MADYFLDTSALVKRYITETGSLWISNLLDSPVDIKHIAHITRVEVVATIARRTRGGDLSLTDGKHSIADFKRDSSVMFNVSEITETILEDAVILAEKHALRGYDAVQLAAAMRVNRRLQAASLPTVIFVTADKDLLKVAPAEGLIIDNPNHH